MSKKAEIVAMAANLIHKYGYHNIGIKKILDEANIPKGSFYYYFDSKEDLAIAVIDYHIEITKQLFNQVPKNLEGLKGFFNIFFQRLESMDYKKGCPIGNLILELADEQESFRLKLLEWSMFLENEIAKVLEESNLQFKMDSKAMASFIVASFEGVILKAKLEKTKEAIDQFNYYVFECLLK